MRNTSYKIALCGVTVAGGTIFLALAAYLPVARLGMLACATVVLFLPFSMNFFGGGVLSFAATALLAFFVGGGNGPVIALAYVCFFGLQPMLIYVFKRFGFRLVLRLLIEAVFAALVLFLIWKFVGLLELLAFDIPLLWLELAGVPCFLAYEYLMERVYVQVGRFATRFGRKR